MPERNHIELYKKMLDIFPRLFNFKDSGLLFVDKQSHHLYTINYNDEEDEESVKHGR